MGRGPDFSAGVVGLSSTMAFSSAENAAPPIDVPFGQGRRQFRTKLDDFRAIFFVLATYAFETAHGPIGQRRRPFAFIFKGPEDYCPPMTAAGANGATPECIYGAGNHRRQLMAIAKNQCSEQRPRGGRLADGLLNPASEVHFQLRNAGKWRARR